VDDLDDRVTAIARRGIQPARRHVVFDGGPTKVTYQDPDGNELSLGGSPSSGAAAAAVAP
jgi:hypothetical protein